MAKKTIKDFLPGVLKRRKTLKDQRDINKVIDFKKALSALEDAKFFGIDELKKFTSGKYKFIKVLADHKKIAELQALLKKASEDTWIYVKEVPETAIEKYKNMDKSTKIMAISAMAGGAVISIPFIIAAGPISIVSALATLGLGALAAGGYGVAGGIVVTAGGAALSAALAGMAANKLIKDPDVEKLIENYKRLEKIIKQNFAIMEKNQQQFKRLYSNYGELAEFVADLHKNIENEERYDSEDVKEKSNRISYLIEDLESELRERDNKV
jgi:hypothetical protein